MVFRKLWNILLLSNGISTQDDSPGEDKWARFRAEREEWEREHPDGHADAAEPPKDSDPTRQAGSSAG